MRPIFSSRHSRISDGMKTKQPVVLKQPKIAAVTARNSEQKNFPWKPIFRIIFGVIVVVAVVWLLNSPLFIVKNIEVSGNKVIDKEKIAEIATINRNIWLYPVNDVVTKIKQQFPLVADVAVYRGLPNSIRVVVAEKIMAIEWKSNNKKFVLGLDGKLIVAENSNQSIPVVVDTTNFEPTEGKSIVTPGFVQFIINANTVFESAIGVQVDHFEVGATTFDVTVIPESGPKFILDSSRDPLVQLKAGKLVLDQHADAAKQYIDLRVPLRAYFQ